jgi:tetratricopeptide (TPR) repeat protein
MRSKLLHTGFALCVLLLASGCSQEKDRFLNRTYHRLTTRDNGWFNANEKLKEVVRNIEDTYPDDYDQVLPIFRYGTEQQSKAAMAELEKCIDKCSLVIERHKMEIKGQEKNTWIDDAYFVIAKSHFYKQNFSEAERGFAYIARKYKGENRQMESYVWLARTAIQMEQYAKAQSALDNVKNEKKLPRYFDHGELSAVQAELDLKRGKIDDAIIHLEHAIPLAKRKRERVRWSFILGQLYEVKSQEDRAIQQYARVVKMGPPYEMAFHAQIFQALAFNKGDSKALRQKLSRMLRDEKHVDHFDMIHYAIAEIDLKERQKEDAMARLRTSAEVSTTDTRQKAKSFMKLADIYFDDRTYASAQKYYDSTRTLLAEEHDRYDEVNTRADVLGDLVEQLAIIDLEDSLQALAQLDEKDLEKRVREMIRDRERAEAEKIRLEEEARERLENAPAGKPAAGVPAGGRGNWYFYDAQQISRGLVQFRKRWGTRNLEDDWRRKDKSGSALAESIEDEGMEALEQSQQEKKNEVEAEWKDPSFYTKDLPRDDAALEASNTRICNALYVSGMIYKEQLKDIDNAIESFEILHSRFDDCRYTPESFYQLYRIYLEKEQTENFINLDGSGSQMYASIILDRYPDSEFARLVRDPNIMQADEARRHMEESAYREVYQLFRQSQYSLVVVRCDNVIDTEIHNHFRSKYYLLKAMAIGGLRDLAGFREALMLVKNNFAGSDEARAADELLANMDKASAPPPAEKAQVNYKSEQGQHYFAIVVPNKGNDMNTIKTRISNFNNTFFSGITFQITNSFLDSENQVVLLSFFDTRAKAMEYYSLFSGDRDKLAGINDQGFPAFPISPDNYSQLFKNKDVDGYASFFTKNYLDRQ